MSNTKPFKILVIRFSSIGDIILCSPVLRCLKNNPSRNIVTHLLTKKSFTSFTSGYPYLDKVIAYEDDLRATIRDLKEENYDFVLDLHNNLRSMRVKRALGKPSQAFNKLNIEKWLLTTFKIDRMPQVHIVDRLMDAARPLEIENDGKGLDFFIPEKEKVSLQSLPAPYRNGYVGFVIGGTYATKRLPADKIIEICRKLHKPVILLGGPEDADTGNHIESELPGKVFNACGKYSLNASASLVEQAHAIISHDTGLMHIAAAFSKPMASIWGNTVPELGMYPYYPENQKHIPNRIFEIKDLKCRPCSKIGYNTCPKKHFRCMNDISAHDVASWVNSVG
ncbi:MAG: glycosyltransferase family 9 protein [Bacteroidetes bacterium]|nr:MAG: glycosyltransferase family 9 protein [Bacteroidota bacterium]